MSPEVQQVELHGTRRYNISLKHVPATFSCVCKCCDFVPATCPRCTTVMRVASVRTTHLFVAATCPCNMTPRVCPPFTLAGLGKRTGTGVFLWKSRTQCSVLHIFCQAYLVSWLPLGIFREVNKVCLILNDKKAVQT